MQSFFLHPYTSHTCFNTSMSSSYHKNIKQVYSPLLFNLFKIPVKRYGKRSEEPLNTLLLKNIQLHRSTHSLPSSQRKLIFLLQTPPRPICVNNNEVIHNPTIPIQTRTMIMPCFMIVNPIHFMDFFKVIVKKIQISQS